MQVTNDHHVFKSLPSILKISEPLKKESGYIHFHNYATIYENGKFAVLTTHKDWAAHFYEKYNHNSENHIPRLKPGINHWRRNKADAMTEMHQDSRDNFNMDARIDFVAKDESNHCYHLYSFYSNKKNADRAYRFYDFHRGKLLNFIGHFKREARDLIREANDTENLIEKRVQW